jgi:hypothetical protein
MGNRATSTTRVLAVATWATLVALTLAACSHEAADWKSATLANTVEAYQGFLQQYPNSSEATLAQARVKQLTEQRDWQIAASVNTRDAYQQFMAQHPNSQWAQEAKIRSENFSPTGLSAAAGATDANPTANAGAAAGSAPMAEASAPTAEASTPTTAASSSTPAAIAPPMDATAATVKPSTARASSSRSARPKAARVASSKRAVRPLAGAHTRSGAEWVQLGAFGSRARAESHWRLLSARFAALQSLHPRYVAVRTRAHRLYRVQVRVSSAAAASGLCARLKRHAQTCMRVNAA